MQRKFLEYSYQSSFPLVPAVVASTPIQPVRQPSLFEMQSTEASHMRRAAEERAIGRLAELAIATWDAVDATVSTIIGPQAVTALYKRSLYLNRVEHPWLAAAYDGGSPAAAFMSLKIAVLGQSVACANAALSDLLQAFRGLLVHLLGESLAQRLLEPVGKLAFKAA